MPQKKKLASLRLDDELLQRIDAAIERLYSHLPATPGRNAVLEAWILKSLQEAEAELGIDQADWPSPGTAPGAAASMKKIILMTALTTLLTPALAAGNTAVHLNVSTHTLPAGCQLNLKTTIAGEDANFTLTRDTWEAGFQVTPGQKVNLILACQPGEYAGKQLVVEKDTMLTFNGSPNDWDAFMGNVPGLLINNQN